jgi:hypothetical protein
MLLARFLKSAAIFKNGLAVPQRVNQSHHVIQQSTLQELKT